jgi:hypothetical protein
LAGQASLGVERELGGYACGVGPAGGPVEMSAPNTLTLSTFHGAIGRNRKPMRHPFRRKKYPKAIHTHSINSNVGLKFFPKKKKISNENTKKSKMAHLKIYRFSFEGLDHHFQSVSKNRTTKITVTPRKISM